MSGIGHGCFQGPLTHLLFAVRLSSQSVDAQILRIRVAVKGQMLLQRVLH